MTRRIVVTPDRVSISRPGYDALTSPRTSSYMALDSALDIERPLEAGVLINIPIATTIFFPFATTYPAPPVVELYEWNGGFVEFKQTILRYTPGGTSSIDVRSPYVTVVSTSAWGIRLPGGGFVDSGFVSNGRNWAYIVWKTH